MTAAVTVIPDAQWIQNLMVGAGSGPIWAAITVAVVKAWDAFQAKKKAKREELAEINSAHANLNKSLQGSLDALSRELVRMREENEDLRSILERRERRVAELEAEIAELRKRLEEQPEG